MRKRIFLALTIAWMVVIFAFSNRNADLSTEDSYTVGLVVGEVVVDNFKELPVEQQLNFAKQVDHPVRKTAHATEYAVLAMLLSGVFLDEGRRPLKSFFYSWLIATAYAATDEFHQLFVTGRSGQLRDVLLDSCGALIGILVLWAVITLARKISGKQYK